jgi:hypothetical protein
MWEQNKKRVSQCIKFLTRELDKSNSEENLSRLNRDTDNLTGILLNMTMYLSEFNFYPSDIKGNCCEVAFFTSLLGDRWNLEKKEKISFEQMFKYLINHCQGKCAKKTKYVIIISDNWDDNIANFWQPNIDRLKDAGVILEVHMMIGKNEISYEL